MTNSPPPPIKAQDADFYLPPYTVSRVFTVASETIDWGLKDLQIPSYWRQSRGEGVRVAVLDTGAELAHPDLKGAVLGAADFTGSYDGPSDRSGHGTHVAGIIAARENNFGVIGVAPGCQLLIAKVLGDYGSGDIRSIQAGIEWAVQSGAQIISMSLGSPYPTPALQQTIQWAVSQGVYVIAAAGNAGPTPNTVGYPAAYPETLAVGSVATGRQISSFSSRGNDVDLVAPGDQILSTYLGGGYARLSGTSMATPFVSGVVALLVASGAAPAGQSALIDLLIRNTIDLGARGPDPNYGFGLIDPAQLFSTEPSTGGAELKLNRESDLSSSGQTKLTEFLSNTQTNEQSELIGPLHNQAGLQIGRVRIE